MRKIFLSLVAMMLMTLPIIAQESNDSAFFRVAQFSVDAPLVDVYLNGELLLEAVDFPSVSDWIELEAGTFTVDIVVTGGAIADALLSDDYDLGSGNWTTLSLIGEVNRDTLALQALVNDLNAIPDGEVFVSLFHAITDLDPINVFAGETELVRLLSYPDNLPESDGYASNTILAGDYNFDIQDADGNSIMSLDTTTLGVGRAYFLAAVGTAENPLYVFISTDVGALTGEIVDPLVDVATGSGTSLARIGHFSVSAGETDIYLNGELVLEAVQFGDVSDYMELEAGIHNVAIVPTGDTLDNALYEGQIALVADSVTLISAIGFVGDNSLTIVTANEDNVAPDVGLSRIAFFQAVPSVALFDLSANDNTLMQGVAYPHVFEGASDGYVSVDIVAGAYEFVVEGGENMLNIGNITTGAGRVYLIVSAGTENAPVFFLISSDFPSAE